MGIFASKRITDIQTDNLNALLPDNLKRNDWNENHFKGIDSIHERFKRIISGKFEANKSVIAKQKSLKKELKEIPIKRIKIFNIEPFDCTPLGMIDIGIVKKFSAASTGDRFAGGAIGYAIESAIDKTWTESNLQESAVNEAKFKLLEKAKNFFPKCNLLFKFQIDFRELGSSGSVFLYLRGTAAIGENKELEEELKQAKNELIEYEKSIQDKLDEIKELQGNLKKIPKSPKEIDELLS